MDAGEELNDDDVQWRLRKYQAGDLLGFLFALKILIYTNRKYLDVWAGIRFEEIMKFRLGENQDSAYHRQLRQRLQVSLNSISQN